MSRSTIVHMYAAQHFLPITTIPISTDQGILVAAGHSPRVLIDLGTVNNAVAETTTEGASPRTVLLHEVVLRIVHDHEHGRDTLMGLHEQMFEIQQDRFFA
mmetsp:Transcript_12119/g.20203  ORF Transcript_12119/g.20203 Transcript_12119/m.20203 type:complete len:101 (+) Transcript_12119:45-347(+)